jgi:Predicted metal-dependent protease of the PAD1/JAB1 superfamily
MLSLSCEHYETILQHAYNGLPNEACGLIAGNIVNDEKIIRHVYLLKNTDESPEHFSMDPQEQFKAIADMRSRGLVMLGNFHSHPASPARPSQEDIRLAFDPSLTYIIVSLQESEPQLKSFLIQRGAVTEESYRVLEHETDITP